MLLFRKANKVKIKTSSLIFCIIFHFYMNSCNALCSWLYFLVELSVLVHIFLFFLYSFFWQKMIFLLDWWLMTHSCKSKIAFPITDSGPTVTCSIGKFPTGFVRLSSLALVLRRLYFYGIRLIAINTKFYPLETSTCLQDYRQTNVSSTCYDLLFKTYSFVLNRGIRDSKIG